MPKGQKAYLARIKNFFQLFNKIIVSISDVYCLKSDSPTIGNCEILKNKIIIQILFVDKYTYHLVKNSDISVHKTNDP